MVCVGQGAELGGKAASSTNSPGANLDAHQRGPEDGEAARRGAAQGSAAQSLQATAPAHPCASRHGHIRVQCAIHKKAPQSGVFLWMACVGPEAELDGKAASSTKSPGGHSPERCPYVREKDIAHYLSGLQVAVR